MHLTLKRLKALGSVEVWWGVGYGYSHGSKGGGEWYRMWNHQRVDQEGDNTWSEKKEIKYNFKKY